jgi:hypothetical protein
MLAFVRTGGESRPWGLACGHPLGEPEIWTVPEGRDRDLVAGIAAPFAERLLNHLRSPAIARPAPHDEAGLAPIRQVWLPNGSHLDMLHHVAFAYTFTRWGGEAGPMLNALGRACAWLFRESQMPGQQQVVVATQALRQAFTFPTENVRQEHLAYLLAWLATEGDGESRYGAAEAAERLSISTTLDPALERDPLEPLVEAWRNGGRRSTSGEAHKIAAVLEQELGRRLDLVGKAWTVLREDTRRENVVVDELVTKSLKRQWRDWGVTEAKITAGERPFVPSVETDRSPAGAAMGFLRRSAAAEFLKASLLHDDGELLAEAIARGDAFVGEIVGVVDEGEGRATNPVWTVRDESGGALRLREESQVCVVGLRKREARIRRIHAGSQGERLIDVALTNLKTAIRDANGVNGVPPKDPRWIGERLTFASASSGGIEEAKIKKLWARDMPGGWLTKSEAPPDRSGDDGGDLDAA